MRLSSGSWMRSTANLTVLRDHWASEIAIAYGLSAGDQSAAVTGSVTITLLRNGRGLVMVAAANQLVCFVGVLMSGFGGLVVVSW
jgi:hypothetical protein